MKVCSFSDAFFCPSPTSPPPSPLPVPQLVLPPASPATKLTLPLTEPPLLRSLLYSWPNART